MLENSHMPVFFSRVLTLGEGGVAELVESTVAGPFLDLAFLLISQVLRYLNLDC